MAEEEGLWKITPEGTKSIVEANKRKEASIQTETRTEQKPEPKTEQKPEQIENGDGYNHRSQ